MDHTVYNPEEKEKFFTLGIWLFLLSLTCIFVFIFLNFLSSLSETGLYAITVLIFMSSFFSLVITTINFIKIEEKFSYLGFLLLDFSWGLLITIYSLITFEDLFNFSSFFPFLVLGFFSIASSIISLVITTINLAKGNRIKINKFTLLFGVPIFFLCLGVCLSLLFLSGAIG